MSVKHATKRLVWNTNINRSICGDYFTVVNSVLEHNIRRHLVRLFCVVICLQQYQILLLCVCFTYIVIAPRLDLLPHSAKQIPPASER